MKQYLLGTLPEHEASAVEESYFTNPLVFDRIRQVEIELICAYLDGALTPEEKARFESRYLKIPALRQLVDQVRARRAVPAAAAAAAAGPVRPRLLPLALAATFVVLLIVGLILFRRGQQPPQVATTQPPRGGINLFLEPGVTMGPESQAKLLRIPRSVEPVSLTAELPGQLSSADYVARLKRIDGDRNQPAVWSSNPTRSLPRKGGQQVTVTLDSSIFLPGDYILELEMQGGPVRETYVFRAIAASP